MSCLGKLLLESHLLLSWGIRCIVSLSLRRIFVRCYFIEGNSDRRILFIYDGLIFWLGKLNRFFLFFLSTLPTFIYFVSDTNKWTYTNPTTHTPSYYTTKTIRWWSRWAALTRSRIWWVWIWITTVRAIIVSTIRWRRWFGWWGGWWGISRHFERFLW